VLVCNLLVQATSHAGVIYEWKAVNDELPHGVKLRMEFTDAAVAAGSASFHVPFGDFAPMHPESALISLFYSFQGNLMPITYKPHVEQFREGYGSIDLEVSFLAGGFLNGSVKANDSNSDFSMASYGRNFMMVTDAHSDEEMYSAGCGGYALDNCRGAIGHIQQVRAVPEPATLGLLAVGGIVALGARRKSRRRQNTSSK
jgi:hypothetical protein